MFPIVKDHYLNDNKNIYNHLLYLHHPHYTFTKKYWSIVNTIYIFLFSLSPHLLYMVEPRRIELLTSCVQSRRSPSWAMAPMVGLRRFELLTSPLSGVRSNHLSYRPKGITAFCSILSTIYQSICVDTYCLSFLVRRWSNRRFPYGYLVTTSPQSWIIPW